jgi:hypothetical protein
MRELEAHLQRGELDFALAVARTLARERGEQLELDVMLRFLPLVAEERPESFDAWGLRWLGRWCTQLAGKATVDDAVEVTQGLAEIPLDSQRGMIRVRQAAPLGFRPPPPPHGGG